MDHSARAHIQSSSVSFDLSFACDEDEQDEPTDGLYGPGRTIGKFLDAAGGLIDSPLSRLMSQAPPAPRLATSSRELSTPLPHRDQVSASVEVSFVCDRDQHDEPIEGLYGPGRTIQKFLDAAGGRIDTSLSKAAERVGYGPRMTAERIRRRFRLIQHSFKHYERRNPAKCWECLDSREEFLHSPLLIEEEVEKLKRDVRRLVKYAKSNILLTRKQAIDRILELSFGHDDFRCLFEQFNATRVIEDTIRLLWTVRHSDFDDILLSSSRKALTSLKNAGVNSLLKQWTHLQSSCEEDVGIYDFLWRDIAPFLRDEETAFLVVRILKSTVYSWTGFSVLTKDMMRCVASNMSCSVGYFEWDEFEDLFYIVFQRIIWLGDSARSIALDYSLQFLSRMPWILKSRPFRKLSTDISELGDDFRSVHVMKAAIMRAAAGVEEKHERIPEYLGRLRGNLTCSVERAVCDCLWDDPEAFHGDSILFTCVAKYIDSPDPALTVKAWEYANFFLGSGRSECDLMLEALGKTKYSTQLNFKAFGKEKREKFYPIKGGSDEWKWETLYRGIDKDSGEIVLGVDFWLNGALCVEKMEYPTEWLSYIIVVRGEAFSATGEHPLFAGRCTDGTTRSYIAKFDFQNLFCKGCYEVLNAAYFPIKEGTRLEDLRVEESCPHQKKDIIPEGIMVMALRYPPDEYPDVFSGECEGADATGPFSWRPVDKSARFSGSPFSVRVNHVPRDELLEPHL